MECDEATAQAKDGLATGYPGKFIVRAVKEERGRAHRALGMAT